MEYIFVCQKCRDIVRNFTKNDLLSFGIDIHGNTKRLDNGDIAKMRGFFNTADFK